MPYTNPFAWHMYKPPHLPPVFRRRAAFDRFCTGGVKGHDWNGELAISGIHGVIGNRNSAVGRFGEFFFSAERGHWVLALP
jgi:hypothetical protein